MAKRIKGKHVKRKGNQRAVDPSEFINPGSDPLDAVQQLDAQPVARHKRFCTDGIDEIISYDDGCELYRYCDNIEILSDRFRATRIKGKFLTVKEWKDELIYTFEDEFGALQQLAGRHESEEYDKAINKIWKSEKDIAAQIRYGRPDKDELKGLNEQVTILHLEERAVTARRVIADELFRFHCAAKSCDELFTVKTISGRKPTPLRSSKKKLISLAKATERIAREHKKRNFKGERIELCRVLLSQYLIKGKPGYSPEELNNNVAQRTAKTGRCEPRPSK